jgi:hypothetical protein
MDCAVLTPPPFKKKIPTMFFSSADFPILSSSPTSSIKFSF